MGQSWTDQLGLLKYSDQRENHKKSWIIVVVCVLQQYSPKQRAQQYSQTRNNTASNRLEDSPKDEWTHTHHVEVVNLPRSTTKNQKEHLPFQNEMPKWPPNISEYLPLAFQNPSELLETKP